jgi:DNA-binding NtrC family response regulator
MLEVAGWPVITAADGDAAIRTLSERLDDISVVLLDYMMPGMPSTEIVTELNRLAPRLPIILSSGHAESVATATFPGDGLAGFLQKPYTMDLLTQAVKEVLTTER